MNQSHVLRFLPDIIGRTVADHSPIDGLSQAMVTLLDPVDQRLLGLDRYFDPFRAPTSVLPYLATWVDLGWLAGSGQTGEGLPPERLRRLLALAPWFAKRRGTAEALETMLRVATDAGSVRVADATRDPTITRPFHLVVELPAAALPERRLVELIVRFEKPIHLTHEIVFVDHS